MFGKSANEVFDDKKVVSLVNLAMRHNEMGVKQEIGSGADINSSGQRGMTPLIWAIVKRDPEAVSLLLKLGANPNFYQEQPNGTIGLAPPVFLAASAGESKILRLLLEHGGAPGTEHNEVSALMHTLDAQHYDCAEILLAHGADINFTSGASELSAFIKAASVGYYDRALWILNHGYTHRMDLAQRALLQKTSKVRPGQEEYREKVLKFVADYLAQHPAKQSKNKDAR
ncbi:MULTISPECIES: ankyrin repeat domain-containing protein [unclassified Duganella]|uniref:ankyrin repeat domain-containing protein n=1 Tax=unclassified Duganella TaxID=2636909 RepID=UPI0013EEE685|nr:MULTISPECIES: ankyrin repeat domain-containing protein [unclassified Duganella]